MGKETGISSYLSAYDNTRNDDAEKKSFSEKRFEQLAKQREYEKEQEEIKRGKKDPLKPLDKPPTHSIHYYTKFLRNSDGSALITRRPETMGTERKKKEFLKYVSAYESECTTPICEISKLEIRRQMIDYAENHSSYVILTDNALHFSIQKIVLCNIAKIFLYKLFFPRVFDFKVKDECITFDSNYIEKNFDYIFCAMEKLFSAIVFDGALSCAVKACTQEITSYGAYTDSAIDAAEPSDFIEDYLPDFKSDDNSAEKDKLSKKNLMAIMLPSMAFISKLYYNICRLSGSNSNSAIRLTTLFSKRLFYKGKRADDARLALTDMIRAYKVAFDKDFSINGSSLYKNKPFNRLMNAAFVNNSTGIYELDIMQKNVNFEPYLIDGFLTKFVIDQIIRKNGELLKYSGKGLDLFEVQSNPNCIVRNITGRDYETLSEILSSVRTTIEKYYFTESYGEKQDKLISLKPLLEIIHHFNSRRITGDMNELVPDITLNEIDIASYNRVTEAYFTKNECTL